MAAHSGAHGHPCTASTEDVSKAVAAAAVCPHALRSNEVTGRFELGTSCLVDRREMPYVYHSGEVMLGASPTMREGKICQQPPSLDYAGPWCMRLSSRAAARFAILQCFFERAFLWGGMLAPPHADQQAAAVPALFWASTASPDL